MGIADRLFTEATDIAEQFERSAANLEREILDLEMQLQNKKAALHLARAARERARNFVPMRGADFYCPVCWVTKKRTLLSTQSPATSCVAMFAREDLRSDMDNGSLFA